MVIGDYRTSPYRDASVCELVDSELIRSGIALPVRYSTARGSSAHVAAVLYATRRAESRFSMAECLLVQRLARLLEPLPFTHRPVSFLVPGIQPLLDHKAEWYSMLLHSNRIEDVETWVSQFIKGTAIITDDEDTPYVFAHTEQFAPILASYHRQSDEVQRLSLVAPGVPAPGQMYYELLYCNVGGSVGVFSLWRHPGILQEVMARWPEKENNTMSSQQEKFTLGVEEEYQLVDPHTWELSSSSGSVLHTAQQALGEKAQPELQLSQVEAATPVCQNLQEVRAALIHLRAEMSAAAEKKGTLLVAAATHPFSHWKSQRITPKERYKEIAAHYQQLAREPIFGCHVHVGISEREMRLQVMNRARISLAPLLALAANSPFWQGEDTGYASFRTVMWSRWPTSGQPQHFSSLAEYDALLQALIASGCIDDATNIYWDIRLSERFDTIEFRVTDCCLTVDETVMIAGLIQAIVQTCYEQARNDVPIAPVRPELLRAAHWRAARFGISEELIDVVGQRSLPAENLVEKMLDTLRPALEKSGNWQEVSALIDQTLRQGNGSMRQRAVYQQNERMEDLLKYMATETRKGIV